MKNTRLASLALAMFAALLGQEMVCAKSYPFDYSLPQHVKVLPVFLVPTDQVSPSAGQKALFMQHLLWAQTRYMEMLGGRTTFELATGEPAVVTGKQSLAQYRLAPEGGASTYVGELLDYYRYTRFNCPYVFVILLVNPKDDYPTGGGRTFNRGWNSGGGMLMMSTWNLDRAPNFQSTLQHELGHSFGLPHVDVYGYSMSTNASIMSYNPAQWTNGLTPSATPGILIPEDIRVLLNNKRVFPDLTFSPAIDTPSGYSMAAPVWLGAMTIPGQLDYALGATTPFPGLSPPSAMLLNQIKPSAGPGITYDGRNMWHSGSGSNGWVYADITFPMAVALNKVTIHSQHSGLYWEAQQVRIETLVGTSFVQIVSATLQQVDQTIPIPEATAQVWRFWFYNPGSVVLIRGLEFFSAFDEIFPPQFPTFNNPPTVIETPSSQSAPEGGTTVLSTLAVGSLPIRYQWRRNGINLANGGRVDGATGATLSLRGAVPNDTGSYDVVITNSVGSVTSTRALLNVVPAAPIVTTQPSSKEVTAGTAALLTVETIGTAPFTYQWAKDGINLGGATSATYTIASVTPTDAGRYTVVVTNSLGSVTSAGASLTVVVPNPGRLINLSILAPIAAGETMTLGTVLGGAGTSGTKALVVRAAGPALTQLGVTGVLPDPTMTLNNTSASPAIVVAANNDWGGNTPLGTAFAQVGAFPYASSGSKDAGMFQPALASASYTVQVSDTTTTGSGTVIAEIYEATPNTSFTTTTPRLINVSVLKQIAAGATLTAGFVIGGSTNKTVLVRAIGPTLGLAPFNIGGVMADPKLELFNNTTSAKINENNDWSTPVAPATTTAAQLIAAFTSVGAFQLANTATKDAVLLVTLAPGEYSARVNGFNGGGGTAIVEIYEVP